MLSIDRNILPDMKPTRHSYSCGQPLGPGVAHHGMRNLLDHFSDTADVVVPVASVPRRSALNHVKLMYMCLGMWVPYRGSIFQMWSY